MDYGHQFGAVGWELDVTKGNMVMTCRSACPTPGQHQSWGECARAANIQVGDLMNASGQKTWDRELNLYRSAREQGIQPASTRTPDIHKALDASDKAGTAVQA